MIFFSVPKQQKLGKRFKKTNKVRQVFKFIVLVVIVINLYYIVNALQQESDIAEIAKAQEVSNPEIVKEDAITRVVLENLVDEEYLGYKVAAFLEIPKIKLETNVLAEYSKKGLDKCVSKFWGSDANCVGNFCIAGHNYQKPDMFNNVYKLKEGDTLWKIAKAFRSTIDDIVRVNGIENPDKIEVGRKLFIPKYVRPRAVNYA